MSRAPAPFLSARGVTKRYGHVTALQAVDLDVAPGEIVALAGENGSGKSTLVKILAGNLQPDGGEIAIDGEAQRFRSPREAIAAGVALVAQEPAAAPQLSIAENVLLSRLQRPLGRFRWSEQRAAALPLLQAVGLDVDPARRFASLRSGEQELAEVAKALASEPRLLILDEATTRLPDPERLFGVIDDLREQGVATIIITHRLSEIRRLADRAVVLRDGELVGELAREELTDERISTMMVGRDVSGFFHRTRREPGPVALRVEDLVVEGADAPVSLEVRRGEILGLAGLVGSGRTELLETIAGLRPHREGRVELDGESVPPGSTRRALAAGISLVPEDRMTQGLVLGASVSENIALRPAAPLGLIARRREGQRAEEARAQMRIRTASVATPVSTLSGGNQQKVVIARSLSHRPRLLVLDEPTRGIDVGAKEEIYRVLDELLAEGMAILIASSELLELLGLCDRIAVMFERRIAGELTHDNATEERIALLSAGGKEQAHVV